MLSNDFHPSSLPLFLAAHARLLTPAASPSPPCTTGCAQPRPSPSTSTAQPTLCHSSSPRSLSRRSCMPATRRAPSSSLSSRPASSGASCAPSSASSSRVDTCGTGSRTRPTSRPGLAGASHGSRADTRTSSDWSRKWLALCVSRLPRRGVESAGHEECAPLTSPASADTQTAYSH